MRPAKRLGFDPPQSCREKAAGEGRRAALHRWDAHRNAPGDQARRLPPAGFPHRRSRAPLRPEAQRDPREGRAEGAPQRRAPGALEVQWRAAEADQRRHRRPPAGRRPTQHRRRVPDHPRRTRRLHPVDRGRDRPGGQQGARRALHVGRPLLHPVRGRGLPQDHLVARPPRRAQPLHGADRSGQGVRPPALQRQPGGAGPASGRSPLRGLARPLPQALLPVRPGGRRAGRAGRQARHHERPHRRSAHLCRPRYGAARRLRHGRAEAIDEVGRRHLRPRIRPRPVHDRRGARLQFRRDGEQGAEHLQLLAPAG